MKIFYRIVRLIHWTPDKLSPTYQKYDKKLKGVLLIGIVLFLFSQSTSAEIPTEQDQTETVADMLQHSTLIVQADTFGMGEGSGFYISPHEVLTNHHVMGEALKATLTDYQGDICKAKVIYWESGVDLALLHTDCTGSPLKIAASVRTGQTILVMGNPWGEDFFVSKGIVSSTRRNGYIATDAFIDGGNSGGPVVNLSGEVVGVTRLGFKSAYNMGLAISIESLNYFMQRARGE